MKSHVPHVTTELECPNLKQPRHVNFEVNVFRGADHGGVDATACSEFLASHGAPTCGKDCIHTQEAHKIHQQYVEKHQEELRQIGRNVLP